MHMYYMRTTHTNPLEAVITFSFSIRDHFSLLVILWFATYEKCHSVKKANYKKTPTMEKSTLHGQETIVFLSWASSQHLYSFALSWLDTFWWPIGVGWGGRQNTGHNILKNPVGWWEGGGLQEKYYWSNTVFWKPCESKENGLKYWRLSI